MEKFDRPVGVQVFRCSGVQVFRCSGVQVFRCSGVQVFRCSELSRFCCWCPDSSQKCFWGARDCRVRASLRAVALAPAGERGSTSRVIAIIASNADAAVRQRMRRLCRPYSSGTGSFKHAHRSTRHADCRHDTAPPSHSGSAQRPRICASAGFAVAKLA